MSGIDLSRALAIPGWMSETELRWLGETAQSCDAILEIGGWFGRSSRILAENVRGMVTTVDPWTGPYYRDDGSEIAILPTGETWSGVLRSWLLNMADLREQRKICPFACSAWRYLVLAADSAERYDFVFLDGDHRYVSLCQEIEAAKVVLTSGGILSGHDYGLVDWPGVKRAVDEAFPDGVQVVDTIWSVRL